MLIIFDMRDDLITTEQAADLAQKTSIWTLCQEWRIIPMQHLEPIPKQEKNE